MRSVLEIRAFLLLLVAFSFVVSARAQTPTLRSLATARGFTMGAGATDPKELHDSQYAKIAASQYNAIEPANTMKMRHLEPSRGVYDFSQSDVVVAFANAHGQKVTATAPVWFDSVPSWLTNGGYSPAQLTTILHDYIYAIIQHYHNDFPGVVNRWSVVSEATHGSSVLDTIGTTNGYPSYITLAYQYARQADPTLQLCYDDYGGEGLGIQSDAIYNLVSYLKSRGLIDCVGLEGQWGGVDVRGIPPAEDIVSNINRLGTLGLDVYFSQVEIGGLPPTNSIFSHSDIAAQAKAYSTLLSACLSTTACKAFFTWGISDKFAYCDQGGMCAPLPFDARYKAKLAYYALQSALTRSIPTRLISPYDLRPHPRPLAPNPGNTSSPAHNLGGN